MWIFSLNSTANNAIELTALRAAAPDPEGRAASIGTYPVKPNPVWVRFLRQLEEQGGLW
jgi:hypothetical protein